MPLYEYHCQTCRRRFTLLVRTFEPPHAPPCKYCHSPATERLVSRVALLRSDESRMQALADPSNLAGLDESDPVSMGRWMRRMGQAMGDDMGGGFDEMVERLEAGEAPENVDAMLDSDAAGDLG